MTNTPVFFFGHGSPMSTLGGPRAEAWAALGQGLAKPKAIVAASAHWYVPETAITANSAPPTIHDFRGFPPELYAMNYPAPGAPEIARRVAEALAPLPVRQAQDWGLDHGSWAVLKHVFPDADVPTLQLSLDGRQPPAFFYDLGKRLAPLRAEGVLIAGSGEIVHNLRLYFAGASPHPWGARLLEAVKRALIDGDDAALINYPNWGEDAAKAIPTPEHYVPLLVALGARQPGEPISFVEVEENGWPNLPVVRFG